MNRCGDANPNGNIALAYKGGCGKEVYNEHSYRCTGCDGLFHKSCIFKHFELEKSHDWGRQQERQQVVQEILAELQQIEKNQDKAILQDNFWHGRVSGFQVAQERIRAKFGD